MSNKYISRFKVSDSGNLFAAFDDGDIVDVVDTSSSGITPVHGMSMDKRIAQGFVIGNEGFSFSVTVIQSANLAFQDMLANWDISGDDVSVSFLKGVLVSNQTFEAQSFTLYEQVMPAGDSLQARSEATASTITYDFVALNRTVDSSTTS